MIRGLPERLKIARELRGYGPTEAGRKVGVSRGSIWKYETGELSPKLEVLVRMADLYNTDPAYLLFGGRRSIDVSLLTQEEEDYVRGVVKEFMDKKKLDGAKE